VAIVDYTRALTEPRPVVEDLRVLEQRVLNASSEYGRRRLAEHRAACLAAGEHQLEVA
jgi:hypothetical protein